jgi:hypothetical protein
MSSHLHMCAGIGGVITQLSWHEILNSNSRLSLYNKTITALHVMMIVMQWTDRVQHTLFPPLAGSLKKSADGSEKRHIHLQSRRISQASRALPIHASCWLLVWFILRPWRWSRHVPPIHQLTSTYYTTLYPRRWNSFIQELLATCVSYCVFVFHILVWLGCGYDIWTPSTDIKIIHIIGE